MRLKIAESEAGFTDAVIDLCRLHGWMVNHQRPARTKDGWRTTIQGHAGFPDIVATRDGRLVIAELKSAKGRTTPEQDRWLERFRDVPGAEVHVWMPADWDEIVGVLT